MPKVVDGDERRVELANAAIRVIARAGLGAATVREVAAEAGWTTGGLTHYFADKRELLKFTLSVSLERRRAERPRRHQLEPAEALRETLVNALPLDEESRRHWLVTVAFAAEATGDDALAAVQRDAYRDFRADLTRAVERAGRASDDGARREAERLIAAVDGVALQALFDPETWPPERQLAALDAALAIAPA